MISIYILLFIQFYLTFMVLFYFAFLGRGAEPNQLAFSAALGITLGVFPICGMGSLSLLI